MQDVVVELDRLHGVAAAVHHAMADRIGGVPADTAERPSSASARVPPKHGRLRVVRVEPVTLTDVEPAFTVKTRISTARPSRGDLGEVGAVFTGAVPGAQRVSAISWPQPRGAAAQTLHTIDHVHDEVIPGRGR